MYTAQKHAFAQKPVIVMILLLLVYCVFLADVAANNVFAGILRVSLIMFNDIIFTHTHTRTHY